MGTRNVAQSFLPETKRVVVVAVAIVVVDEQEEEDVLLQLKMPPGTFESTPNWVDVEGEEVMKWGDDCRESLDMDVGQEVMHLLQEMTTVLLMMIQVMEESTAWL